MLSTAHLLAKVDQQRTSRKLTPKYIGPFPVVQVISPVAYKLELPSAYSKVHPIFHISLLKKFVPSPDEYQGCTPAPPPPVLINQEEEYEVEQVLDKKLVHHQLWYLIKWKGYPLHDATWEPLSNLENAKESIDSFEASPSV